MSSHTHSSYQRSSMWIQTTVVCFFGIATRLFRFWIAVFWKLFLFLLICLCSGVIGTPANVWNGEFWSNSKQLLEIDYCCKDLRLGCLRESQLRPCCVVQGCHLFKLTFLQCQSCFPYSCHNHLVINFLSWYSHFCKNEKLKFIKYYL